MFSSQILDVAIGLVFLYFFLSLLCSVLIEGATSMIKKRPRMLYESISVLLGGETKVLENLYKQPFFMGTAPKGLFKSLVGSLAALLPLPSSWLAPSKPPSYISSRSFVFSLLESLKQHPEVVKNFILPANADQLQEFKAKVESLPVTSKLKTALLPLFQVNAEATLQQIHTWYGKLKDDKDYPDIFKELLESFKDYIPAIDDLEKIKKLLGALSGDSVIKNTLMPLLESAGKGNDALDKALAAMEKWYDEAMDRASGWYKRYSQTFALILAFIVALALNADTFAIGKALYRDPVLRTSIVAMAEDAVKKGNPVKDPETGKAGPPAGNSGQAKPGQVKSGAGIPPAPKPKETGNPTGSSSPAKPAPKTGSQEAAKPLPPGNPQKPQAGQPGAAQIPTSGGAAASDSDQEKVLVAKINKINADIKKMETLNLPLGWGKWWDQWLVKNKDNLKTNDIYDFEKKEIKSYIKLSWFLLPDFPGFFLPNLLGILFTAFMVSLGSNFWFEWLNKLVNMRNTGQKPATKEEKEAKKA